MPLGSSSAAPVINPGPSFLQKGSWGAAGVFSSFMLKMLLPSPLGRLLPEARIRPPIVAAVFVLSSYPDAYGMGKCHMEMNRGCLVPIVPVANLWNLHL